MSSLELTINPGYVKSWQVFDALREIIQNAIDAKELGYEMEIEYNPNRKEPTLKILNKGVTIKKDSLLLGTTTKDNDPRTRGQFGEGYKLAWLVLLRNGLKVWCKSGNERWIPNISYSNTYETDILKVDIASAKYENSVITEIRGLCQEDWEALQEKFLFEPFGKPNETDSIDLGYNKILTGKKYKGHLFVKGIWVGLLPGKYYFGYDLDGVELDRDRKLAEPWSLRYSIKEVLNSAARSNAIPVDELYALFQGEWAENESICESYGYGINDVAARISEHFHVQNGEESIPVDSTSESIEAKHYGMRGIVVSKTIKTLIEHQEGKFEDKKQKRAFDSEKVYSADELSMEESNSFMWAIKILDGIGKETNVIVVDFVGDKILGSYKNGEIRISKKILLNKKELIATIVHEIAHNKGKDGEIEHEREIESLFGKICSTFIKV